MTAETTDTTGKDQQGELDKEHAFANLDQTIGDREQAIEDVEQERLDDTQETIDRESSGALGDDGAGRLQRAHRQREQGLAQARRDAHQEQLDQAQSGRDRRQSMLDVQQRQLEEPVIESVSTEETLEAAGDDRLQLANERAAAARLRAAVALKRAEDADNRVDAMARRHDPRS